MALVSSTRNTSSRCEGEEEKINIFQHIFLSQENYFRIKKSWVKVSTCRMREKEKEDLNSLHFENAFQPQLSTFWPIFMASDNYADNYS